MGGWFLWCHAANVRLRALELRRTGGEADEIRSMSRRAERIHCDSATASGQVGKWASGQVGKWASEPSHQPAAKMMRLKVCASPSRKTDLFAPAALSRTIPSLPPCLAEQPGKGLSRPFCSPGCLRWSAAQRMLAPSVRDAPEDARCETPVILRSCHAGWPGARAANPG